MKIKTTIFILIIFPLGLLAQNLVPNGSFEDFNSCPDTTYNINAANHWFNPGGFTPDYFNPCDTTDWNYGVPHNQYGSQLAKTGVSYAGIISSWLYFGGDSVREYISVKLTDSLKTGKKYEVEFYVSLADISPYSANNIGAYFSDTLVLSLSPYSLAFIPQVQNNYLENPLTDKDNWIEIKNTYIAQGGEKYIIIGNFNNDASTDTTNLDLGNPNSDPWAYYYIDDVSVICLDCFIGGTNSTSLMDDMLKVYPNPSSNYIYIENKNSNINKTEVMNSLGIILFTEYNSTKNVQIINFSTINKGIYFLKIYLENDATYIKKIIIN